MADLFSPVGTSLCILTDKTGAIVQRQATQYKAMCEVPTVSERGQVPKVGV